MIIESASNHYRRNNNCFRLGCQYDRILFFLFRLATLASFVACSPETIAKLSEQIIIGRPLSADPDSTEGNRIITIDDFGNLQTKNLTSSYVLRNDQAAKNGGHQQSSIKSELAKLKFKLKPLGDDSIGSLSESLPQLTNEARDATGEHSLTSFAESQERPLEEPQVEDIRCDKNTLEATIVLPKSFVIEPEFNDAARQAHARNHCSLVPIKFRLYPTFHLRVTDLKLCGVTTTTQQRAKSERDELRARRARRKRKKRHDNELEQVDQLVYLLNIRFPVIKSLRTNEDTYATLVCLPNGSPVVSIADDLKYNTENEDDEEASLNDQLASVERVYQNQLLPSSQEAEMQEESRGRPSKALATANKLAPNVENVNNTSSNATEFGEKFATQETKCLKTIREQASNKSTTFVQANIPVGALANTSESGDVNAPSAWRNNHESSGSTTATTVAPASLTKPLSGREATAAAVVVAPNGVKHVTQNVCLDQCAKMTHPTVAPSSRPLSGGAENRLSTTTTVLLQGPQAMTSGGGGGGDRTTSANGGNSSETNVAQSVRQHKNWSQQQQLGPYSLVDEDKNTRSLSRMGHKGPPSSSSSSFSPSSYPTLSKGDNNLNLFWLTSACSLLIILLIVALLIEQKLVLA